LLDNPDVDAVLAADFGVAGRSTWRLFEWTNDGYVEHPGLERAFTPGAGFLLVTQDGASFDVQAGRSTSTAAPYGIELSPGWNLIGNPFAFPVAFDDLEGDLSWIAERAYFDG